MFLAHTFVTDFHSRKHWNNLFWLVCYKNNKWFYWVYLFILCKHLLVFFEDLEFHTIFFPMNWKKYFLILEVVLRDSCSLDFFQLVQVLFNSSIHGFNLAQIIVQDMLLQSLLKVTTPLKYVFNAVILKRKNQILFDWLIFFIPFYTI